MLPSSDTVVDDIGFGFENCDPSALCTGLHVVAACCVLGRYPLPLLPFCSTDPREAEWRRYQQDVFGNEQVRYRNVFWPCAVLDIPPGWYVCWLGRLTLLRELRKWG